MPQRAVFARVVDPVDPPAQLDLDQLELATAKRMEGMRDTERSQRLPVLDAYANTAVRRARPSSRIETDDPAPEPPPSPIAMRDLEENG